MAREKVEHDTGYSLISQTFTLSGDRFPAGDTLSIPARPIASISSITYYDESNSQQTLATTVYGLDQSRRLVYLKYDQEWPGVTSQHNCVVVTFIAGYGLTEACVPRYFKQAILLLVGQYFVHRGDERFMPTHGDAYRQLMVSIKNPGYL